MPRPKSRRLINTPPVYNSFKPSGVRARDLEDLEMTLDELEAIRLADYEGLNQDDAAIEMDISRSTFSRLVESARKKSSQFLLDGKRLVIGGGPVHFRQNRLQCRTCARVVPLSLGDTVETCPYCGSSDLADLASGFGHGDCCLNED